jgi:hypothetical protein
MYELVKKKSWAVRIISGLAIFFVITQILKLILRDPEITINERLMKTASELNRHAPIMIDSMTRFDNAIALSNDYK